MTDDPLILPRTADHLPACVEALAEVHAASGYPAHWPADPGRWLSPQGTLAAWVAVDGPTVLGHVLLTRTDPRLARSADLPADQLGSVARLFTVPGARGGGLATALLGKGRAAASARGLRAVLEVEAGAEPAVRLYERTGWRLAGSSTADWTTADGRPAMVRVYLAPPGTP